MKRVVYQIDAFTSTRFTGNPAGVVINAEALSKHQMQALARELNNSETAFISRAQSLDHDVWIRYFTPTAEVPVCGHATIASGYAIWREQLNYPNPLRIKTGAGILSLSLEVDEKSDSCKVSMIQGKIQISAPVSVDLRTQILEALGIANCDLEESCPIEMASTGHSKIMIGIHSKSKLDSLAPNMDLLRSISKKIECNGFYVFTFDSGESGVLVSGRMFAPAIGINEDPVTGNANGPLGAYLISNRIFAASENGTFSFVGKQGEAIGRTGYVGVVVDTDENGMPTEVTISGEAVVVFRCEIDI
ncbi:PhzF family isomerase [Celerinatantimonas yamalensis]|uniref:PhzF family isomerase n=1 Tax=Celerinatantimonas yamalensis TaxID=559956 RepID=A0ABW9G6A9_9GAMM